MTQLNINLDMDKLTEQILSSDLNSVTKGLAVAVFNAYMEAQRDQFVQAKNRERSEDRQDMRNGYYMRDFKLPVGNITLSVPRTRSGEFSTDLFDRYQRMDQSLVLAMMESVINGVSTRKVSNIVEALCGETVSKSLVSDIMTRLDPEIEAFRTRPLNEKTYDYLYVDAMYIKVRENGRVVSKAVYIAQGVTKEHYREILGFMVSGVESKDLWTTFFQDLRARGLTKPKLIISDAHAGLIEAIKHEFTNCPWQRCSFHFTQNIVQVMPRNDSKTEREMLRRIFKSSSLKEAEVRRDAFINHVKDNPKYEKAVEKLDEGFTDATQYMYEPQDYYVSLKTTNGVERINREIRRREKVIGIFPNVDSAVRLIGSVIIDIHELFQEPNRRLFQRSI